MAVKSDQRISAVPRPRRPFSASPAGRALQNRCSGNAPRSLTFPTIFAIFALPVVLAVLEIIAGSAYTHAQQRTPATINRTVGADTPPDALTRIAAVAAHQADPEPPHLFDESTVRDFHFAFAGPDWEADLKRLTATEYVFADLEADGVTYPNVGLRIKGNSSARGSGRKVPLSVTLDATIEGQDLMGYDTINLNSGFMNPTFINEILTLSRLRIAQPMPQAAYVRMFADGEYFGLYTLVQQIEGTFDQEWYGSGDGMRFKGDAPSGAGGGGPGGGGGFRSNLSWLGEDLAAYRSSYELKSAADDDAAYTALRELTRVLAAPESAGGPADADFPSAIDEVLDVDSALWYIASINLFTNYDSYYAGHNFFLYRPDSEGRFHILSWDVNESFGVFPGAGIDPGNSEAVATTDPFLMAAGASAAQRPLIRRLLAVPTFRADYLAHYRTLLTQTFEPDALEAAIIAYQALIADYVREDPNKLYTFEDFTRGVWEDLRVGGGGGSGPGGGGRAVPGIMKVATRRYEWLSARPELAAPDHSLAEHVRTPAEPTILDSPRIDLRFEGADAIASVDLVVAVERARPIIFPMSLTDGMWSATIPSGRENDDVTYYARVELADGRSAFHPALNQTQPWAYEVVGVELPAAPTGDLVINEIMAINNSVIADPEGEFGDWVELYNRGAEPISLSSYFLSDSADDPWAFPLPDVTLPPGGHFLIWCDSDTEQGADHAPFGLNGAGESVVLSTETMTVDRVDFGAQMADVSFARATDGSDEWVMCASATPGARNVCIGSVPSPPPTAEPTSEPTDMASASPTPAATRTPPGVARNRIIIPFAAAGG